ncbi:hypothetical protein [Hymenobacter volaticus]|uniref:Carboxypeptidase regulatory-like domain-containing protein n=1 Tax=Hymenobacter volaticus TaxID=2932254 RepID=A0ABY4GEI2_9BACT|nr:hypothetical protein [Hymenobacter volaticus]UOQ69157.1 hypothetical protein MUN86_25930 [Hymenobacter volaticus]
MLVTLLRWAKRSTPLLLVCGLAGCSRDVPVPMASITGQMAPVATVGRLVGVVAAGGGTEYPATVDFATGTFSLAVPPGTYQLKFTTAAPSGATQLFPQQVAVTAAAGTTVTPAVPLITHDRIGRGTLRWTLNGKSYTARAFIKVYGEGKYFNLWGRSEEFSSTADVKEIFLVLPEQTEQGPLFAGVGTYPLGGPGRVTAFGESIVYPTNDPVIFWHYRSPYAAAPTGTVQLTRYDAERGLAAGTFAFNTTWATGALVGTPAPTAAVTNGEFDITF